jgi:hypothetical protein
MTAFNAADAVAATLAASAMVLATQPLDTTKVNLQLVRKNPHTQAMAARLTLLSESWQAARGIVASRGVAALWSGTPPALYAYGMEHAVLFTVYEAVLRALKPHIHAPGSVLGAAASSAACCAVSCTASSLLLAPADAIKCMMQAAPPGMYRSSWHALTRVVREEGATVLFRNYRSVLARDSIFFGTYIFVRELLLAAVDKHGGGGGGGGEGGAVRSSPVAASLAPANEAAPAAPFPRQPSPPPPLSPSSSSVASPPEHSIGTLFLSGGVAGAAAWCVATPMDVLNSRRQAIIRRKVGFGGGDAAAAEQQSVSLAREVATTVRAEGVQALFRGSALNVMRGFVGYGVFTAVYINTLALLSD